MSVVIQRDHPSGSVGLSVAGFFESNSVVVGLGSLDNMKFMELSESEAVDVQNAIGESIVHARGEK